MNQETTISWIFLATALASQQDPTDFAGISMIADGINHAVPSHQEIQKSLTWLIAQELVEKNGNKYSLTNKGVLEYQNASTKESTLLKIWGKLEERIKYLSN